MPYRYAWQNGSHIAWDECVVHVRSQGAMWGANVFEGVRAYWRPEDAQLLVFRLDDHLNRLFQSMKLMRMEPPFRKEQLRNACLEVLQRNEFRENVHIVIVAHFGMPRNVGALGMTDDTGAHITAIPAPRSPAWEHGLSACISSWRRISDDTMPPRIKAGANYHNGRLAHQEAERNGYDIALLLNQRGVLAEAPGANFVIVRNGTLVTPPASSGVLEGITVDTLKSLVRNELNIEVREIDRTELYVADEAFLCGTLAEVLPIVSVDRLPIGDGRPGPLTQRVQTLYAEATTRECGRGWTTSIPMNAAGGQSQ